MTVSQNRAFALAFSNFQRPLGFAKTPGLSFQSGMIKVPGRIPRSSGNPPPFIISSRWRFSANAIEGWLRCFIVGRVVLAAHRWGCVWKLRRVVVAFWGVCCEQLGRGL